MKIFIATYAIVVAGWAVVVASRPDYVGNVGFLVLGALIGTFPVFLIEEFRRDRERKEIAAALFHELANRVGRCCFDFEDPWGQYITRPVPMNAFRMRKFVPVPAVIYPAVAPRLAILGDEPAQAVIAFYVVLAGWERDLENIAAELPTGGHALAGERDVRFLAKRLRETLVPGDRALERLGKLVDNAVEIARTAVADGDRRFPDEHPNAGKPMRERIALILREVDQADVGGREGPGDQAA